jgi:DNA-binding NtrC family response regulator
MSDPAPIRLLIVDDQQSIRQLCAVIGGRMGLSCAQAASPKAALEQMKNGAAALMLADLELGGGSGLELLAEVKRRWPLTEVALMGSYGSLESAAQAMRLGAYDFVGKPFRVEELQRVLERMAEKARLVRENQSLRNRVETAAPTALAPCTDLEELERITVQRVFEQVGGDIEQAQSLLGISRATLYRKIKRYGIETRPARRKASAQEIAGIGKQMAGLSQS